MLGFLMASTPQMTMQWVEHFEFQVSHTYSVIFEVAQKLINPMLDTTHKNDHDE